MTDSTIIMYGTEWCSDCVRSRRFFDSHKISFIWIDIEKDKTARDFVRNINSGNSSVPTIVFPDGEILIEPSDAELANHVKKVYKEFIFN